MVEKVRELPGPAGVVAAEPAQVVAFRAGEWPMAAEAAPMPLSVHGVPKFWSGLPEATSFR